jgi:membrane protease YdiL (CAAX protease family)
MGVSSLAGVYLRIQDITRSALVYRILNTAAWGLWHLPLHFMPGSFQQGLLAYPPALIAYIVAFFPGSIIMSWVYYRTGRSTLTAILIHYFGNLSGELFSIALPTGSFRLCRQWCLLVWFSIKSGRCSPRRSSGVLLCDLFQFFDPLRNCRMGAEK